MFVRECEYVRFAPTRNKPETSNDFDDDKDGDVVVDDRRERDGLDDDDNDMEGEYEARRHDEGWIK